MSVDGDGDGSAGRTAPGPGADHAPKLRVVGSDDAYPDWEAIYRDNVDRIYRVMYAKVGNRADAEDLTAEVFMTALRPLRVSASVGEVRAYLFTVARTTLAAHWRRTLGVAVTTLDDESIDSLLAAPAFSPATPVGPHPDPAGNSAGRGSGAGAAPPEAAGAAWPGGGADAPARAEAILAELSPRYQRILRLRFLESCSLREAAAELGVTVANAKVLQHRALRRAAEVTRRWEA
ncbi:RNA polymerase sigma factor [Frankia sp. AgB32]|nr:RNA polymerase sigma factor [Frankia sp. AgB32]MCK9897321.1 RNA polymerase sigma factor [Frankia sp. AgB32]